MRRINDPILRLIGNLRQDRRNAEIETELCIDVMTMWDAAPIPLRNLGFSRMVPRSARDWLLHKLPPR